LPFDHECAAITFGSSGIFSPRASTSPSLPPSLPPSLTLRLPSKSMGPLIQDMAGLCTGRATASSFSCFSSSFFCDCVWGERGEGKEGGRMRSEKGIGWTCHCSHMTLSPPPAGSTRPSLLEQTIEINTGGERERDADMQAPPSSGSLLSLFSRLIISPLRLPCPRI